MPSYLANAAETTLASSLAQGATSMVLTARPSGIDLGSAASTRAVVYSESDPAGTAELVQVTNVVGTTCTIVRAQEGSSDVAHAAGSKVVFILTRLLFEELVASYAPKAHAASHQNGGADEIATATAAANAIPKAGSGGTLAAGWIPAVLGAHSFTGITLASTTSPITLNASVGASGQVLTSAGAGATPTWTTPTTGTVTSVALSLPSILSVSGSPITTSGTLAVTLATQAANLVFAGPTSGGAATPAFRSLVLADVASSVLASSGTADATGFLRGDRAWSNAIVGSGNPWTSGTPYLLLTNNASFVPDATLKSAELHIVNETTQAGVVLQSYRNGATPQPFFRGMAARGSYASPTALALNDQMFAIQGIGYLTSAFATTGPQFTCRAAEAFSASTFGSYMHFANVPIGGTVATGATRIDSRGVILQSSGFAQWAPSTTLTGTVTPDTAIARLAAASVRIGFDANATPVANILSVGESSRGGTDSDVAGASGTIQPGMGTGNATPAPLIFKAPVAAASGTTQQTQTEGFRVQGVSTAIGISFFAVTAVIRQTIGALTNSVTSGGVDGTIANYTDLTTYANDAAAIRNNIYQLARSVAQITTALRNYGLGV